MNIEPTRTIPWIEFAPDISGVWSVAGTLRDDGEAAQDREDEDGQGEEGDFCGAHAGPPAPAAGAGSSSFLTGSETTAPPWVITVAW